MERLSNARIQELISLAARDPHKSDWHRDTDAAVLELQERREAEKCRECGGRKSVPDGIVAGCAYSKPCPQCSGTGKNSPADELLRAAKAKLKDCREYGDCSDADLIDGEMCSHECIALDAAISRYEEKR